MSYSVRQEEQSFFFIGMFAFLSLFSKNSVFNSLSGLWEMTFSLAPNLLEFFADRDKIVMDVCKSRYYEKNCKSAFFHWKSTFSFRKFLFSTFTQLLQKWSCNLHNTCLNLFGPIELLPDVAILSNTKENRSKSSGSSIFFTKYLHQLHMS